MEAMHQAIEEGLIQLRAMSIAEFSLRMKWNISCLEDKYEGTRTKKYGKPMSEMNNPTDYICANGDNISGLEVSYQIFSQ